jgi:hypothetical protein
MWCAEDYDLICRTAGIGNVFVLPECLVQYRVYPQSISRRRRDEMLASSLDVSRRYLETALGTELEKDATETAIRIMRHIPCGEQSHWKEALEIIERYTTSQARGCALAEARTIRRETAKQLLRYVREYCPGNTRRRFNFERLILRLDASNLFGRVVQRMMQLNPVVN